MDDREQKRIASRLSIMFVLGVILAFAHATDAQAITKLQAASMAKTYSRASCEFRVPQNMRCVYRPLTWHYANTEEPKSRRTGPWKFVRTYSKVRFAITDNGVYGIEFGCNAIVGAVYFGFARTSSGVRCSPDDQPRILDVIKLAGKYS